MAMLSVTTILLLALLASIAFPQFRTALIWLTVAIIVFLAYISDGILQQRFDDQQTTTEQQGSQRFGPIAVPPVQKPLSNSRISH
jgi:hypothetical protein